MEVEKAHCNSCLHTTKHFIVAKRTHSDSAPANNDPHCPHEVSWCTTYTMLECCGCENVSLRKQFTFSEYDDVEIEYFPPQTSRQLPKWHDQLPKEFTELLREVYVALHANSRRLALMGARTLVDMYMNDQLGDAGGFAKKISLLEEKGQISKINKIYLEAALEAGHAAAHRGHKANESEVNQVIDIIENLLQNYVLEDAAKNLKAKTPSRGKSS
jgi:hypothetical protein